MSSQIDGDPAFTTPPIGPSPDGLRSPGFNIQPLSIGDLVDHQAGEQTRLRPYHGLDEIALVAKAQEFDPTAVGELYERYEPGIARYVYYRVGDIERARDIAGDVIVKALFQLDRYQRQEGVQFSAWLYRIAHNASADHFRRQASRPQPLPFEDRLFSEDGHRPADYEDDRPLDTLFDHNALRVAFDDLTDEQAQVVELKFVDGLSNKAIGEIMGKSEGAIKSLQHRALASLGRSFAVRGIDFGGTKVNDRPSPEVDYSFTAALLMRPAHMLNYDLRSDTDPARAAQRREVVEGHIIPYIDSAFTDPTEPKETKADINTDLIHRSVLYWLLVEEASISQIERRLGENPNLVLDQARVRILDHLQRKTGLDFQEIYNLLRGTGWLFTVSRPIRTNLVALSDYRRTVRKPDIQPSSTFLIKYSADQLERMTGNPDRTHQRRILDASMPMRLKRGQVLEPRDGSHILVHQQRIATTEQIQGDEILRFGAPQVFRPKPEHPLVIGERPFGAVPDYFSHGVAVDDCVISLVHAEAHDTRPELSDEDFAVIARQRRDEVVSLYTDLEPISSREIGLPIGHVVRQVEDLLTNKVAGGADPAVREAFGGLSPLHRKLLRLTFVTGMPDLEIAKKLNLVRNKKPSIEAVDEARGRAYELLYNYMLAIGSQE